MLRSLAHLFYKVVFFLFTCKSSLDILGVSFLPDVSVVNILPLSWDQESGSLDTWLRTQDLLGVQWMCQTLNGKKWISYFWTLSSHFSPPLQIRSWHHYPSSCLAPFFWTPFYIVREKWQKVHKTPTHDLTNKASIHVTPYKPRNNTANIWKFLTNL